MLRLFASLLLAVMPLVSQAIEEPAYEVVRHIDDSVELRRYAPYLVAEVVLNTTAEEAGSQAFPILAGYIFGKNKGEKKFEMTAPVTQSAVPIPVDSATPVRQSAVQGGILWQFVLPKGVSIESAPEPLDARVKLREVPETTVAVIRYSGTWSPSNYQEHLAQLKASLKSAGVVTVGEPVLARYNAPFTPWFMRRNEIWLALPPAAAQIPAERYTPVPAGADGIGKRYMGRDIAGVMGWQGAAWLERQEREREERTDLLLAALQLRPGMVVADIGAGTGYLSRRMAPAVMPGGSVLAVDVQPEMVRMLQDMVAASGLTQIRPELGAEDDVRLPAASVDLAIMVDVYHELAYPDEMLASIRRALKPGGRVVFVEYRAEDPHVPIKALHKMSVAQVRREAEGNGLVWEHSVETLPWQHCVVFRKPTEP